MIQPEAYYAAHKEAPTPEMLGRLGFAIVGREGELSPPLSAAEMWQLNTIMRCNKWHNQNREAVKAKWRSQKEKQRQAEQQGSTDVQRIPLEPGGTSVSTSSPSLSLSLTHSSSNDNRSVTVNGNGNGTGFMIRVPHGNMRAMTREFAQALRLDQEGGGGAFFDAKFDPAVMCCAVTGDYHSLKRWRQLIAAKGEGPVREELFQFYRELAAGEDVSCRGAALNSRLMKLPEQKD